MEDNILRYIFVLLIMITMFSSCSNNTSEKNSKPYVNPVEDEESLNKYSESEKARDIGKIILKTPGIQRVVVVVSGNTALIGLDIDERVRSNSGYYKNIAVEKVREIDSNISKIEVTSDAAMYERISKLNEDVLNGRPLSGISQDFKNILKKSNLTGE